ncbi:MAG: hypothetical protein ACJAS1_006669, partial [Oleiphilaceae bacterium]
MRLLVIVFLLLNFTVHAGNDCEVSLGYGVVVSEQQIRVIGYGGRTVYQINHPAQLIVQ